MILVQLRQLATTLTFYVAEEHREATTVAAADRLWDLASAVPGGSDAQLQFVKSFALLARSGQQLDKVAGLLDGSVTLAGLTVDQDLRWELVASLVAGGRLGQEQIDAELERDNTSSGQNAAALAKAAIPTPEAKAAAWESIVVKGELSNAIQASAVAGFTRVLDTAAAGAVLGEVLRGRSRDRRRAHPCAGPADRRRTLPGAADHPGHRGPDGRVPGVAPGGQRGAAPHDAGKPRRRCPGPAGTRGGRLGTRLTPAPRRRQASKLAAWPLTSTTIR